MNILFWLVTVLASIVICLYLITDRLTKTYTSLDDLKYISRQRDSHQKGNCAVVMGGGFAGILSARVLLNHFNKVIIVESEDYYQPERVRSSVPQGAHAHLVLAIANLTLRTFFPGIEQELINRGGLVSDLGTAMNWFYWASWRVRCHIDAPFWCCSRPFLEQLVLDMFLHHYGDQVTILTHRKIMAPILTTELSSLGISAENTTKTNTNLPVRGSYSHLDQLPHPDDNVFRVAGIHVKKRPQKVSNSAAAASSENNAAPDCGLETIVASAESPSGLSADSTSAKATNSDDNDEDDNMFDNALTKVTVVKTQVESDGVFQYQKNPELKTFVRPVADDHAEEIILADLIVDCSGGSSVLAKWCERWKIDIPQSSLKANSMYVSHLFHEPDDFKEDWICMPIYPLPGRSNYFGYLMRVENKTWQVTAMGTSGSKVPNQSLPEFIHHLRLLDNPRLHELVSKAKPIGGEGLHTYHPKMYIRRHWERCSSLPDGVICVGNSACVFDPMYGQGLSGACIAALALNRVLCSNRFSTAESLSHCSFSRYYFTTLADRLFFPWTLCVVEDSRWPGIELNDNSLAIKNSLFGQCLKYWIRQGMVLARTEPLAQATAMGIMNMTLSFTSLLNPPLVLKVVKNMAAELFNVAYTPEMVYDAEVAPPKEQRALWQLVPKDEHNLDGDADNTSCGLNELKQRKVITSGPVYTCVQ